MKVAWLSLVFVLFSSSCWPAHAASRFLDIPVDGWDPEPQIRKQYEGTIVDWIRRVDVHPEALSDDLIEVDLFDVKVRLERTAGSGVDAASDPIHVPTETNSGTMAARPSAQLRWTGRIASQSRSQAQSSCMNVDTSVRITEAADGQLRAIFDIGSFRYELRDGVLIRKDFRRLPREAPVRDVSPGAVGVVGSDVAGRISLVLCGCQGRMGLGRKREPLTRKDASSLLVRLAELAPARGCPERASE